MWRLMSEAVLPKRKGNLTTEDTESTERSTKHDKVSTAERLFSY